MTAVVYNKYNNAAAAIVGADDLINDVFKIALASSVNPTDATFNIGTTDLVTGGGYVAGGNVATTISASVVANVFSLILDNPAIWTASGAGFTFRYAILYNSTTGSLYGYWDYGSDQAVSDGETVSVILNQINGALQVS